MGGWIDPQLLRQFARVSSLAMTAVVMVFIGVAAGYGVDRLVPPLGVVGLFLGGILGAAASGYYLLRKGGRLLDEESRDEGT